MYSLKPSIKDDPVSRWNLPDRIFFGHGACHILAGVFLRKFQRHPFKAVWIKPIEGYSGNHIFVTDGIRAFDYHGYSLYDNLLRHFEKCWSYKFEGWGAVIELVEFDLLDTAALNQRDMRGPDQYLRNPIERAGKFLGRYEHKYEKTADEDISYGRLPL